MIDNEGLSAPRKNKTILFDWIKGFKKTGILFRTTLLTWTIIIVILGTFLAFIIPTQKASLIHGMQINAESIATSIGQVTASAIVLEDYSAVVDHCLMVVQKRPSILFVVVTRKDGFSLVHTDEKWYQDDLLGSWVSSNVDLGKGDIHKTELLPQELYHYSYPFSYSGIDWGWIHIGLSLDSYRQQLSSIILNTLLLAVFFIFLGLLASFYFARKLSRPIIALDNITQRIGSGDLTARSDVKTGDELQSLAYSLNTMTENLQRSRQELQDQKEKAETASKAKSEFLASMSHELRTPLNAVIGFSEILFEQYFGQLNEKQQEYVHDIQESGKHLLSLIDDILDLSKIEVGKMDLEITEVNIRELLQSSTIMIKERCLKHGIHLDMHLPEHLHNINILADERKLKQVMFNLLSNASKFTPDGKSITVEAKIKGAELLISIADSGIGIEPEHQQKIFEEFYQIKGGTQGKTPGTGLGLALTKSLIDMHKGKITVQSEGSGKGSRFTVVLPLASQGQDSVAGNVS